MAKLLTERYEITKKVGKESVTVIAEIDNEDTAKFYVTVRTHADKPQFVFTRSNKDRVMAMGQALQEAAELVDSRKITAA